MKYFEVIAYTDQEEGIYEIQTYLEMEELNRQAQEIKSKMNNDSLKNMIFEYGSSKELEKIHLKIEDLL